MNYVIIGNSASGIAAVESIREIDKENKIILISDEPYLNYSRPLISYLLGKKITVDKINYREENFYKENKVDLILNKKAIKLDVERKTVTLSDKQKIFFDKLLISTGGSPIIPEIKGLHSNGVFTFTKLSDEQKIESYIKKNKVKNAVVIGGGLIGLKATEALIELKMKVTIIELANRILSSTFDKKASDIIKNSLEKIGCKIITENTVAEIKEKSGRVTEIVLKDKTKIKTDMVILAIGVRPNIELVKNTPIKTNRGVIVDKFMQTNIKDIYSAGDCCEPTIAIWPVAVKQGKIAGYNMAGLKKEFGGAVAKNSVELCGIPTISVGETCPTGEGFEILEYNSEEKNIYKKIVLKNNRIVGFIFVGDIEKAGIYTNLIKDKIDITGFKQHLLKEDFGLINLPKEYRKHLVTGMGIEI